MAAVRVQLVLTILWGFGCAGYVVYAPTLPYHEPGTQWSPDQGTLKAQDYVDYIIRVRPRWSTTPAVCMGQQSTAAD